MDLEDKERILFHSKQIILNPDSYNLQNSSLICSREGGPSSAYCRKLFLAYRRMLQGEAFNDDLSDEMVRFFLDDFRSQGRDRLRGALESTKGYLDYREGYGKMHHPIREFCRGLSIEHGIDIDFMSLRKDLQTQAKEGEADRPQLYQGIIKRMVGHRDSVLPSNPLSSITDEILASFVESLDDGNKKYRKDQTEIHARSIYVAEFTRRRARGVCELCGMQAPFKKPDGTPFLEVHHIEWLAIGGEDRVTNTAALCPNCHRRVHILCDIKDLMNLKLLREMD